MATALLFPGQGSHTPEMGRSVARHAPELAELALSELGEDPFERAEDGTAYAQPAIVCASIAAWRGAGGPPFALLAGHSLGELSALVAAGAVTSTDAVRLAVIRGRLMQDAAERCPGGMLALLGDAAEARAAAIAGGAVIANDNGPTQLVAAGSADALLATEGEAKARGLRAIPLAVAGAFHTRAMSSVVEPFRGALEQTAIAVPEACVISSSTAAPFEGDSGAIRDQLAAAIASPVRWRETLIELHRRGVRRFVEAGPGKALSGMVRRAFDDVEAIPLAKLEGLAREGAESTRA